MTTAPKPTEAECDRCGAKATVTLCNPRYGTDHVCRPCAAAVLRDRAFSDAWDQGEPFQIACEIGTRAAMDFMRMTQ